MTSPPVQAALLATARPPAAAGADPAALAATLSGFNETDWSALIEHALAHGSASLLCRHLLAVGAELLPADVATACTTYLAARESVAADAVAQLAFVRDTLAADGINALPFKGPVLALQAYGDPAMREYHDLDILIRREHLSGALATLHDLGYRSDAIVGLRARRIADYYWYNGHDILFGSEGLPLEPHWALSPRTFCAELDTGPIFDRAITIETAQGRRFACFAPEDTLLAAAAHGGKEQWSRLVWAADIAALLHAYPVIDWTAILARAKQAGCLRMTLLAAELASELLEAHLPDHVRAAVARDPVVARLVERVRARLFTDTETPSVFTLTRFRWNARERLGDRVRYASRTLLTARVPHFRTVDLPDRLSFLYPAVRLGHDFVALPVWKALRSATHVGSKGDAANRQIPSDPLATPDFFPMKIDPVRNTVLFLQMSKESFRQSDFLLDHLVVRSGETTVSAEIPKLLQRQAELPTHFILHCGYCGSTLLARYLEELPHCLVLKEPLVFAQLGWLRDKRPAAGEPDPWDDWFRVTLALLARGYPADDAVVVKAASNQCNGMGNLLLDHNASTKIVFVFVPLKVFLLQVLKTERRRRWLREQMQRMSGVMAEVPCLSAAAANHLTDGQRGAAIWLLNSFFCRTLLARPDSHRVLVLNGEDLIARPGQTVLAAANFLGLADDEANRKALEMLRPHSQHSKHSQQPYNAISRAADLADAEARYRDEVRAALSWAAAVSSGWLADSPFSFA